MICSLLYIDPGSSSYIVQAAIAAILGMGFYFKTAWHRIKKLFTRNKHDDPTT